MAILLLSTAAFLLAAYWRPKHPLSPPSSAAGYGAFAFVATLGGCWAALIILQATALATPMPEAVFIAAYIVAATMATAAAMVLRHRRQKARLGFEKLAMAALVLAAMAVVATTAGIVASVLAEAAHFFRFVPMHEFLFGLHWSPQEAIREDQVGSSGSFGVIPLLTGTLLITAIALSLAVPVGLMAAIYLSEFAAAAVRDKIKPLLELLAGVPTVVYGFFAVITLSPVLSDLGRALGVNIASESALAAGLVMGGMLVPFVASLSEDALFAVPDNLRQGALGLGSTRFEMTIKVVVPAALPGIAAGVLLAFSRAVGETMIVVMAAGVAANLTVNPLQAVTTVTVQIVTLLTGDQAFDDPKTLAAFALGLTLFFITLSLNAAALHLVRRHRQKNG